MVFANRNRLVYAALTIITLMMGLVSRRFFGHFPFVKNYVGDGLWTLMVFFGFALLFTRWPIRRVALAAVLFSFAIEWSQLYHAPWIDSVRATRLGGLVLGFSFLWSDLLCYSLGIALGILIDSQLVPARFRFEQQKDRSRSATG